MNQLLTDLQRVYASLFAGGGFWQLAVLALCLTLAWLLARAVKSRVPTGMEPGKLKFAAGGFNRVASPVLALMFVWLARTLLARIIPVDLLQLALPLIASFAAIRFLVYLIRHLIPPSPMLKASERVIAYVMWAIVALYLTGLLPEVEAALTEISFTAGKQKITLLMVMTGLFTVMITLLVAVTLSRIAERRIMEADTVSLSARLVATKLLHAVAILVAILLALPMVGIDLTVLSVFGGAIGVGLGFGLQKVASNYVSGFIILLERSIRVGDLVTVDNRHGKVTNINARYTVIQSLDGTESLLPNEMLITGMVVNHTYTNPVLAVKVPLRVAYDSDLDLVDRLLLEIGRSHPRVLQDPAPSVIVRNLADSGIDLDLVIWIRDADQGQSALKSELYRRILKQFQANGVRIPFPQCEIRRLDAPSRV